MNCGCSACFLLFVKWGTPARGMALPYSKGEWLSLWKCPHRRTSPNSRQVQRLSQTLCLPLSGLCLRNSSHNCEIDVSWPAVTGAPHPGSPPPTHCCLGLLSCLPQMCPIGLGGVIERASSSISSFDPDSDAPSRKPSQIPWAGLIGLS